VANQGPAWIPQLCPRGRGGGVKLRQVLRQEYNFIYQVVYGNEYLYIKTYHGTYIPTSFYNIPMTYFFFHSIIPFRLKEMGTDLSTMVHVDESGQPLRSYKDELSAHPYFISLQDNDFGPHFFGNNPIHPRLNTCSPTTSGDQCPLVITLLAEERTDITIRVTEPYHPRPQHRTLTINVPEISATDDPYSYGVFITLHPGINHIAWCSTAPITFSSSLRYFPYYRPNIWLFPTDPSTRIQYHTQTNPASPNSPYIPSPHLFVSPYPLSSSPHPPSLGLVFSRVPSLIRLSQLVAGATGLLHPAVSRIHPTLSMVTFHPINTSLLFSA
jgi:hypothetical protein